MKEIKYTAIASRYIQLREQLSEDEIFDLNDSEINDFIDEVSSDSQFLDRLQEGRIDPAVFIEGYTDEDDYTYAEMKVIAAMHHDLDCYY